MVTDHHDLMNHFLIELTRLVERVHLNNGILFFSLLSESSQLAVSTLGIRTRRARGRSNCWRKLTWKNTKLSSQTSGERSSPSVRSRKEDVRRLLLTRTTAWRRKLMNFIWSADYLRTKRSRRYDELVWRREPSTAHWPPSSNSWCGNNRTFCGESTLRWTTRWSSSPGG